ncbi:ArnT family glycosyltransferase [Mesorhizobium yinganensis]|uniref:ArnT family glycosyltransferase n=1 Tax=Mesorhizobium yinganensis TaxID=3157707 RepID=UPI0032B704B7
MRNLKPVEPILPYALLALFFAVSWATRPLLPVDETRYLTVAWEMHLRDSFFVPTLNFEPYFQKPPLLFWLIDLAWGLFGPSRAAALAVIFLISSSIIYLTRRLAIALFPDIDGMSQRVPWLVLGSAIFVIYASLILFDLLLTAFVLAACLALIAFSRGKGWRYAALAGLFVGLGVLTKGPVVFIHLACPIALYPLWRDPRSGIPVRTFFAGVPLVILAGCLPVAAWLGPALYRTGLDFAYNLVWRQAEGRISGSLQRAHARPFYFYLLLLPAVLIPWGLSFDLWRSRPWRRGDIVGQDRRVLCFLILWIASVLIVFSLISGKQPHYLVPLLPAVTLLFGYFMADIRHSVFPYSAAFMLAVFGIGQVVAAATVFHRYDLSGLADFVAARKTADWAYVGRYQGQITFLAGIEKPFEIVEENTADEWLGAHPTGYLINEVRRYPDSSRNVAFSHLGERGYLVVLRGAQAGP